MTSKQQRALKALAQQIEQAAVVVERLDLTMQSTVDEHEEDEDFLDLLECICEQVDGANEALADALAAARGEDEDAVSVPTSQAKL